MEWSYTITASNTLLIIARMIVTDDRCPHIDMSPHKLSRRQTGHASSNLIGGLLGACWLDGGASFSFVSPKCVIFALHDSLSLAPSCLLSYLLFCPISSCSCSLLLFSILLFSLYRYSLHYCAIMLCSTGCHGRPPSIHSPTMYRYLLCRQQQPHDTSTARGVIDAVIRLHILTHNHHSLAPHASLFYSS